MGTKCRLRDRAREGQKRKGRQGKRKTNDGKGGWGEKEKKCDGKIEERDEGKEKERRKQRKRKKRDEKEGSEKGEIKEEGIYTLRGGEVETFLRTNKLCAILQR